MLLDQITAINNTDEELEKEFSNLNEKVNVILNKLTIITERIGEQPGILRQAVSSDERSINDTPRPGQADVGVGNNMDEILAAMETVTKQMDAAKRGMSILNKMPDGESRTINRSRVMGNMNRIRGSLRRIEKMMTGME